MEEKGRLAVHEWLAIVSIISFMAMITFVSVSRRDAEVEENIPHYLTPQEFSVLIEGAVENPGSYQVKVGSTLQEVISLAKPRLEADLRKIKGAKPVRNGQVIKIPSREMIEIVVNGAVAVPGKQIVPKGTRLCDLGNCVALTPDADLKSLAKKRFLKDKEEIFVPQVSL